MAGSAQLAQSLASFSRSFRQERCDALMAVQRPSLCQLTRFTVSQKIIILVLAIRQFLLVTLNRGGRWESILDQVDLATIVHT